MRHFFYDDSSDKALIEYLKLENERKQLVIDTLDRQLKTAAEIIAKLQSQPPSKPKVVEVLPTKIEAAHMLGIPIDLIDQIDTDRMGVQFRDGGNRGN